MEIFNDVFLNESLIKSVKDIKSLEVKLVAFYSHELGLGKSIGFYIFSKMYNNFKRNSKFNYFPLLTDLVKKIYENFGIYDKTEENCNYYIKYMISKYFNINIELEKNLLREEENIKKEKKEEKNKGQNKVKDKIENENNKHKKGEIQGYNEEEYHKSKKEDGEEAPPILDFKNSIMAKVGYPEFKLEDIVEEDELNDLSFEDNFQQINIQQFQKDFVNLGKLFWNCEQNFHINEKIEDNYLKYVNNIVKDLFEIKDKVLIDPDRLLQLVKRDFDLDDSRRESTNKEKIILKLFYISYTCNELISELCGKINERDFKYKTIYDFYYTVSKSYNDAINGFIKIKDTILNEKKILRNTTGIKQKIKMLYLLY